MPKPQRRREAEDRASSGSVLRTRTAPGGRRRARGGGRASGRPNVLDFRRRATDELGDVARPTRTASTPARSSASTSSRVAPRRSAIASLPAGTSGSRSRSWSRCVSSSSASRGESRKISGSIRSSESRGRPRRGRRPRTRDRARAPVGASSSRSSLSCSRRRSRRRRRRRRAPPRASVHAAQDRQAGRLARCRCGRPYREPLGALLLGCPRPLRVAHRTITEIPSPSEIAWLSRRGPVTAADANRSVADQRPIGCQTVFSSRKAAISHGLCSPVPRTTRLTLSAASLSSSGAGRRRR